MLLASLLFFYVSRFVKNSIKAILLDNLASQVIAHNVFVKYLIILVVPLDLFISLCWSIDYSFWLFCLLFVGFYVWLFGLVWFDFSFGFLGFILMFYCFSIYLFFCFGCLSLLVLLFGFNLESFDLYWIGLDLRFVGSLSLIVASLFDDSSHLDDAPLYVVDGVFAPLSLLYY